MSWRLNQDSTTKLTMSQGSLAPGMGMVPSDTDSEADLLLSPTNEDEEAPPIPPIHASTFPILPSSTDTQPVYGTIKPKTRVRLESPSSKSPRSLRVSKMRRAKTIIPEVDEIWDELEEGGQSAVASPFSTRRRSSQARSLTPSQPRPGSAMSLGLDASPDLRPLSPNEQTGLLRTSTGRSYRDRKRRTTSTSMARPERGRSQDAVGGWWKMRNWWPRTNKRKDYRTGDDSIP